MITALMQSSVLFMLMVTGFSLGKLKIMTNFKELSKLVVDVSLPALIIMSMQKEFSKETATQALTMLGVSLAVYAGTLIVAYILPIFYKNITQEERGVHRFAMSFSNVGFMGFPIANAFLGSASLFYVAMYNIPFQILAFSIGIWFIAPKQTVSSNISKKLLYNPAIISAFLGFILFLLQIKLPLPLFSFLTLLGETTTPLAMLIVGGILSQITIISALQNKYIWITSLYRLLIYPLVLSVLLKAVGFRDYAVPILIGAMPVAANTSMLAEVYGGDSASASGLVMLSTMLSSLSIPLLALILTL